MLTEGKYNENEIKNLQNPLIDELKDYWNDSEIKIMNEMLSLIDSETYQKSFEEIILSKENQLNKYITEKSTSY